METLHALSYNVVLSHLTKSIEHYIPKLMKAEKNELINCLFPIYNCDLPFILPVKFSNAFFKSILKSNYSIDINELVSLLINSNIFLLTQLDVSKSEITNEIIGKVKQYKISTLDISNCRKVTLSQFVSEGTNRWWVDTLEELRMRNSMTAQSITSISLYPQLRVLNMSGSTLAIGNGKSKLMRSLMKGLTNLEEIDISETNIPLKWLAEFKHAPKLKYITARFKIENKSRQPLSYFEPPKNLKHLDISCNVHSPTGVSSDKLYESRLTTKSAKTIQKLLSLQNLKHLDLSFCGIPKENISLFSDTEAQLDFLGLFGNEAAIYSNELPAKIVTRHITTYQLISSIKYYRQRHDYMKIILQRLYMNEKKFLTRMQTSEYIEAIKYVLEDGITGNKWRETSLKLLNLLLEHSLHSLIISNIDIGLAAEHLYSLLLKVLHSICENQPSWDNRTMRGVLELLNQLRENESTRVYEQDILTTTRLRTILLKYLDNINRDAVITQEVYSVVAHIDTVVFTNTFTEVTRLNELASTEIKE